MSNILQYFEATVSQFPHKTAVACADSSYTFEELKKNACQLASVINRTVGTNQPILVIVDRGIETTALFLSTVYSGNYYIPIDPDMPLKKIQSIMDDSAASVILGTPERRSLVTDLNFKGTFLTLDDSGEQIDTWDNVPNDTPLYMVYTSGSTGNPKGVLKSHGSVISFIKAYTDTFSLGSSEIIGNQTPLFFDASAKDLYLTLFTGATLEIIPSTKFVFPVTLIEYMNERRISYICWVPTALSLVTQMNTFLKVTPTHLKRVFFVGEVFPMKQLRKWMNTLPDIQYVNLYGSSEIAGICCYYEIKELSEDQTRLPMGKALPNCNVYLTAGDSVITDPDVIGELCVSSPALALEYFHDPDKTSAVFPTETLPDGSRERILRSGDLAQYDEQGNLLFVSRKDFQIKHMGRRIELGEIEAAADSLAEIQRCCCLYNDKKKRIELFCELVPGSGDVSARTIQSSLKLKLSDYMVPSRINILETMPFNANGKINRTKLKETM